MVMSGDRAQSQCGACERYRSPFSAENVDHLPGPFCAAFPAGIPEAIWTNQADHRQPIEGDHGLQWVSRDGVYPFPTYAFAKSAIGSDTLPMQTITAAADGATPTGAMVALIPTAADAARLALDGGEAVAELHCTLVYLGEAAELGDTERAPLVDWARTMAKGWESVAAQAFAPAIFNPDGPDPCAVLVLSGAEITEFCETTLADVTDLVALPEGERYEPYVPHITLLYAEPTALLAAIPALITRVGPVSFDRLRLAFAGEITDIPLGSQAPAAVATPAAEPIAEVAAAVEALERVAWEGCPRCFEADHPGKPCRTLP